MTKKRTNRWSLGLPATAAVVAAMLALTIAPLSTQIAGAQSGGVANRLPASQRGQYPSSIPLQLTPVPGQKTSVSPDAISPSGCYVQVDNAHISQYYLNLGIRAAKVNAFIQCNFPVSNMTLQVQLYKTGALWDYLQASTQTSSPSGTYLGDTGTWVKCTSLTQSSFYGVAEASVLDGGTYYSGTVESPSITSLACGT